MEILTASHLTKQYGQGPNLVKALAVSYTHLTLPTIA